MTASWTHGLEYNLFPPEAVWSLLNSCEMLKVKLRSPTTVHNLSHVKHYIRTDTKKLAPPMPSKQGMLEKEKVKGRASERDDVAHGSSSEHHPSLSADLENHPARSGWSTMSPKGSLRLALPCSRSSGQFSVVKS